MSSDNEREAGNNGRYDVPRERRQWLPFSLAVLVHAGLAAAFWWGAHGHADATDWSLAPTIGQDMKTKAVPAVQPAIKLSTSDMPAIDTLQFRAQVPQPAQTLQTALAAPEPTVERALAPKPATAVKRYASTRPQETMRSAVKPSAGKKQLAQKAQAAPKKERTQLAKRDREATSKLTVADKKRQQRTTANARQLEQLREAEMRRITSGSVSAGSGHSRAVPRTDRQAAG